MSKAKKKPMFLVIPNYDGEPKATLSCAGYSAVLTLCFPAKNLSHRFINAAEVARLGRGLLAASVRMKSATKRR